MPHRLVSKPSGKTGDFPDRDNGSATLVRKIQQFPGQQRIDRAFCVVKVLFFEWIQCCGCLAVLEGALIVCVPAECCVA